MVLKMNLIPSIGNVSRLKIICFYVDVPRSSLRRIFTKLYGGHGPVYLKFKRSENFCATLFTALSKSASRLRSIKKAAFMIILSPMGLLSRDATQMERNAS